MVDPSIPTVRATYDNSGLVVPFLDLQKVVILGGNPPPGYDLVSLGPVLSLHNAAGGARLWSLPLPISLNSNHGPMIRWGQSGIALRDPVGFNSNPWQGVDLFRLDLN